MPLDENPISFILTAIVVVALLIGTSAAIIAAVRHALRDPFNVVILLSIAVVAILAVTVALVRGRKPDNL